MNRRAFLFAGLALPTVALSTMSRAADGDASAPAAVEVVYIGGRDCPYCTLWQNRYKADWLASPEFRQVHWVEVDPPHLREAYLERNWPGDLKAVWEQIPTKNGTPRFLIVSKGKVVFNAAGADQWDRTLRALKNVLG